MSFVVGALQVSIKRFLPSIRSLGSLPRSKRSQVSSLSSFRSSLGYTRKMSNKPLNRLAEAKSPYLLQHTNNPVRRSSVEKSSYAYFRQVDWYEWGPEAFKKAKLEDKPIFLSVSPYRSLHIIPSGSLKLRTGAHR